MGYKVVTFENLKEYHNLLMKQLSAGHLVPINVCPQCGALISDISECEYCGAKLTLVVDTTTTE